MTEELSAREKCYKCGYRDKVPGSAHSRCRHPHARTSDNPLNELLAIFASVHRVDPVCDTEGAQKLNIKANAHGIRNGWFNWPYNFDPVWLENCDGFVPKTFMDSGTLPDPKKE